MSKQQYYSNIFTPTLQPDRDKKNTVVLGDMHGNSANLLAALVEEGIFAYPIGKAGFQLQDEIEALAYKDIDDYTSEDIKKFNAILDSLDITNRGKNLIFLGDLFSDRGAFFSDFFTLRIMRKLLKENINYTIIASNHDLELINALERYTDFSQAKLFLGDDKCFYRSMENLDAMIKKGLTTHDEIKALYETVYRPKLVLTGYTTTADKCTLYAHTPEGISLNALVDVYQYLCGDIPNDIDTLTMVDQINARFKKLLNMDKFHCMFLSDPATDNPLPSFLTGREYSGVYPGVEYTKIMPENNNSETKDENDTEKSAWELREDAIEDISIVLNQKLMAKYARVKLLHVHGSEGDERPDNVVELNDILGMSEERVEGMRTVYETNANTFCPLAFPDTAEEIEALSITDSNTLNKDLTSRYAFVSHNQELLSWLITDDLIKTSNQLLIDYEAEAISLADDFNNEIDLLNKLSIIIGELPPGDAKREHFFKHLNTDYFDAATPRQEMLDSITTLIKSLKECSEKIDEITATFIVLAERYPNCADRLAKLKTEFDTALMQQQKELTLENIDKLGKELPAILTVYKQKLQDILFKQVQSQFMFKRKPSPTKKIATSAKKKRK